MNSISGSNSGKCSSGVRCANMWWVTFLQESHGGGCIIWGGVCKVLHRNNVAIHGISLNWTISRRVTCDYFLSSKFLLLAVPFVFIIKKRWFRDFGSAVLRDWDHLYLFVLGFTLSDLCKVDLILQISNSCPALNHKDILLSVQS